MINMWPSRQRPVIIFAVMCVWGAMVVGELRAMHAQNYADNVDITYSAFPKTIDDVGFNARVENARAGYAPFAKASPYTGMVVEGEEEYTERQVARMLAEQEQDAATLSTAEYCDKYPLDAKKCKQTPGLEKQIEQIGDDPNKDKSPDNSDQVTNKSDSSEPTIGGGAVKLGNSGHGGDCYLPAKSNVRPNEMFTTGKYAKINPVFEKALLTQFRKEGGCGQIKYDTGGYTCFGIAQNSHKDIDVKKLTRADAEEYYYKWFVKYKYDKLPDVIAGSVFLAGMGSGPKTAIAQFREFLGLSKGYDIDDNVIRAVENYQGDILNRWMDYRQKFLVRVAAVKYHGTVLKGWMRSVQFQRENGCHVKPAEPLKR